MPVLRLVTVSLGLPSISIRLHCGPLNEPFAASLTLRGLTGPESVRSPLVLLLLLAGVGGRARIVW